MDTAVSHSLAKGGDAIVGHQWKRFLRFLVCLAFVLYILTIKAC